MTIQRAAPLVELNKMHCPNLKVDVTPTKNPYKVNLNISGFEAYHIDICKQYGLQFNPRTKVWKGNTWAVMDFVLPKLNSLPLNTYVDPTVLNNIEKERQAVFIKQRAGSKDYIKSTLKVDPLKGKAPYEDFQLDAIYNFIFKHYFGVFLKQGTGKSYIISSAINYLMQTNKIQKAIILTPGSGLVNLKRAFKKFSDIPEDDVILVTKKNRDAYSNSTGKVFISTFNTFRLSSNYYCTEPQDGFYLTLHNWLGKGKLSGALVLDEAHNIGESSSQQSKAVHDIANLFEYRMPSTGTPADKPDKYYSILKFLHPYFVRYMGITEWKKVVANIGTSFSAYAISSFREEDLRYFLDTSKNNYVKLSDTDVLDLPEHYFKPIWIEMEDGLHKDIYEAFSTFQLGVLKDMGGGILTPQQVFNKFPYLLLSIDDPAILEDNAERTFVAQTGDTTKIEKLLKKYKFEKHHAKLDVLKELVNTHVDNNGEQIVIWGGHPLTLDALAETFKKYNPLVMHGKTKVDKGLDRDSMKDKVVQEFINDKSHKILFASFFVLDEAVDIVNASTQIYVDLPYMFTHFDQSYKRLHRYGQDKTVTTYMLIFANTLDELRHSIVQQKKAFDTDALNNTLPLEDWKKIFAGKIPQSLEQEKLNALF